MKIIQSLREKTLAKSDYVIDIHNHLGILDADGRIAPTAAILSQMNEAGVDYAVVFPLDDLCRGPCYSTANDYIINTAKKNPKFIPFARIDPLEYDGCNYASFCDISTNADNQCPYQKLSLKEFERETGCMWTAIGELERAVKNGCVGIKIHPRSQKFKLTDFQLLDPFMERIKHLKVPLICHTQTHDRNIAEEFANFAETYTDIILIMGHSGMRATDIPIRIAKKMDHVFFDLSINEPKHIETLVSKIGFDRVMLGTDMPYRRMTDIVPMVRAVLNKLKLNEEEQNLVMGGNAAKILSIS